MIQFNLLPDVKLEYLKAERMRRLVISVSVLVTAAALILMALLLSVTALQRKHLHDLNNDVTTLTKKIGGRSDLNKILTVQNQLSSLTDLHAAKPAASRLTDFLSQITPNQASINTLNVDFNQHQITITGTADSLATVNQYVDTLKFTTYGAVTPLSTDSSITCQNVGSSALSSEDKTQAAENCSNDGGKSINPAPTDTSKQAFSDVVLASFGLTQHEADYSITLTYDPVIFDITQAVTLTVPNKITTRSEVEQPTDLFKLPVDTPSSGVTQ